MAPRIVALVVSGWLLSLPIGSGCGGTDVIDHADDDDDDQQSQAACSEINWRKPTDASVVCPMTPDCACQSGTVCCAEVAHNEVAAAACQPLSDCAGVAMVCDGPEDCPSGQVCCAEGLQLSCLPEADCHGIDTFRMCRTNEDCSEGVDDTCVPAVVDSYLEDLVGFCD